MNELVYKFYKDVTGWIAFATNTRTVVRYDPEHKEDLSLNDHFLDSDFELFKQRPEYRLLSFSKMNSIHPLSHGIQVDLYDDLLTACILLRYQKPYRNVDAQELPYYSEDVPMKQVTRCLNWLHNTDFFDAPASTIYHDAVAGGLLYHTLRVALEAAKLFETGLFPTECIEDIILLALVHDWCKIGLYESYMKNVKDDATGVWSQQIAYRTTERRVYPFGHGVSSLMMVMKFFRLNEEESLAIRWHMGEYNVADNEMNDLHYANENYPLVYMLQFADRLAVTNYIK